MRAFVVQSKGLFAESVVVSGSGHVVGKKYNAKDLRDGDIGLHVRVDRGKLELLTPEQRQAAQSVAQEMVGAFYAELGVETGVDWQPGTVVRVVGVQKRNEVFGVVRKASESALMLDTINVETGKVIRRQLPFAHYEIEEVPEFEGIEGLAVHLLACQADYYVERDKDGVDCGVPLLDLINDQATLGHLLLRKEAFGGRNRDIHDHVTRAWLASKVTDQGILCQWFTRCHDLAVLERITDPALLQRLALELPLRPGDWIAKLYDRLTVDHQDALIRLVTEARCKPDKRLTQESLARAFEETDSIVLCCLLFHLMDDATAWKAAASNVVLGSKGLTIKGFSGWDLDMKYRSDNNASAEQRSGAEKLSRELAELKALQHNPMG